MAIALIFEMQLYAELTEHLRQGETEQVCFLFATPAGEEELRVVELFPVPSEDFEVQSPWHVSLADGVRGQLLRRATETGTYLAEAHSHLSGAPASFSPTDLDGLEEWVPHVRWRLGGSPYVALVFAKDSFDALVWSGDSSKPDELADIQLAGEPARLEPTGLTAGYLLKGYQ